MFSETLDFWILAYVFRGPRFFWALSHVFRGPKVPDPGSCFQRPRIFGLWLMFSEDQRFWILAHVFRGLGFWGLAHVFRGPRVFWALAHVFKGPKVLDPGSCFQRPRILNLGSCFQRTKGFFFFFCGFDSRQCVWDFYPSTCKINIFN